MKVVDRYELTLLDCSNYINHISTVKSLVYCDNYDLIKQIGHISLSALHNIHYDHTAR